MEKTGRTTKKSTEKILKFVSMPHPWVSSPLFPPLPQTEPYTVYFGQNNKYKWTSGCDNPLPFKRDYKSPYLRGFDIRHYDLIALFITEFRKGTISENGDFVTGYKNLLNSIGKTIGSKQIQYVSLLLDDLWNTNLSLVDEETGKGSIFRTLSEIKTAEVNGYKTLTSVKLSEEFIEFIKTVESYVNLRLDVKSKLPSPVAQSMYTYLPSRAVSYSRAKPWKISLKKLMEELRLPVEKYPTKSERKCFFTQHKNSILEQLDGVPVACGNKFRVSLAPTKDGKDYNLLCWVDKINSPKEDCQVYKWWVESGGTSESFYEKITKKKPMDGYTIECLYDLGFTPKRDHAYFEMLEALYSEDFNELIGEMRYRYTVDHTIHNPRAYLAWQIKNNFSEQNSGMPFVTEPENIMKMEMDV